MANRCGNSGWLDFSGLQNHCRSAMKLKDTFFFCRKTTTNLDSMLKSRDITLPTKVDLVKAVVFPVVIYGCESWTIKKAECQSWCFWTVVLEKTLESPLDCKEIQQVHSEGDQPWDVFGRNDAKVETPVLWPPHAAKSLQSCPTLCDPMDHSTPGFPVLHNLLELAQSHVHQVGDAIQLSPPLSSLSPLAFNLSQHQYLFQRARCWHQVARVLELQLQHQSFQWIIRTDFL